MRVKHNTLKKSILGLNQESGHFVFNGWDPQMEQIDGYRVSLSHRVAQGLAHELISYGQNHKMKIHFSISATGTSKDKGVSLPL
jgi:hypothetical protein